MDRDMIERDISMPKKPVIIALIGTFDTKGREYEYLRGCIEGRGFSTLLIDAGTGNPLIEPHIERGEVARAGDGDIAEIEKTRDRGHAVEIMSRGAAVLLPDLFERGEFDGVIALGGGGGTSIACAGMRALPLGVPKVMVSTLAGRDVSGYVGLSDIVMIPSITDIAGINRISEGILGRAAAAVCAMTATVREPEGADRAGSAPLVAATMFGNTTPAVKKAEEILEDGGFEVAVFPCSGTSGRTMESLVLAGYFSGVLDITITEWADELAGGVLAAGEKRLEGAAKAGVPQVVAPGCLDMVNFWEPETVPDRFRGRLFYRHNPNITLMRTTVEENETLGRIVARKLNRCTGEAAVFLPLRGLSMIDAPDGPFWLPEADRALFDTLKRELRPGIPVIEMDCNINDPPFARACAEKLIEMMGGKAHAA